VVKTISAYQNIFVLWQIFTRQNKHNKTKKSFWSGQSFHLNSSRFSRRFSDLNGGKKGQLPINSGTVRGLLNLNVPRHKIDRPGSPCVWWLDWWTDWALDPESTGLALAPFDARGRPNAHAHRQTKGRPLPRSKYAHKEIENGQDEFAKRRRFLNDPILIK
jgi:hypothetical protein